MTRFISKNRNKIALLLSIILIGTAVLGGTLAYIVAKTPSLRNMFIAQHSSSLTITKTVEHPFGEDYTLPEDLTFEFTVDLGEEYKGKAITVQVSSDRKEDITLTDTDDDGCFEFTADNKLALKHDQMVKILDILDGTEVTVTEEPNTEYPTGFSVKKDDYTDENNPNAKTITIKRGDNELEFVNEYKPEPVPVTEQGDEVVGLSVDGKKVFDFEIEDGQPDENYGPYTFKFGLEYKNAAGETIVLGGDAPEVTYTVIKTGDEEDGFTYELAKGSGDDSQAEETFSFNNLLIKDGKSIFDKAGTYTFYAYEIVEDEDANIVYDKNLYSFEVVVTDVDMNGYLEISKINSIEGNKGVKVDNDNVDVTFKNEYREGGSDSVRIDITKEVQSDAADKSPAGYTFELWEKDEYENGDKESEDHKPLIVSLPTNELGETSIMITYYGDGEGAVSDGDVFTYILKEVVPNEKVPGITYSEAKWEITVTFEETADGDIDAAIEAKEIKEESNVSDNETSSAVYVPVVTPSEIPVTEEESSSEADDSFEEEYLTLDAGDDQTQQPTEGTAPTSSSDATNSATENGMNTVDASEQFGAVGEQENINTRAFEWSQAEDDNVCEVTFVNTYDPEDVTVKVKISGEKELVGRELAKDEFRFTMSGGGFESATVKNEEDGTFTFEREFTFEKVGRYEFVIEEEIGILGGVTYDPTKYKVIVDVKDNNGVLTADVTAEKVQKEFGNSVLKLEDDGSYKVEFENKYTAAPVTVVLEAKKKLDVINGNMTLAAGDYKFILLDKDGEKVKEAVNDKDGSITFDEIEFTEAGTYTYTIKEDIPDENEREAGMDYDESRFTVTITVTDDGEGQLEASVAYTKGSSPVNEVEFVNKYTKPSTSPTPTPTPSDGPTPGPGTTPRPDIPVAPDDGSGVPATGDNNKIGLYVTVMFASAAAIAALVFTGRRQKGTAGRSKSKR